MANAAPRVYECTKQNQIARLKSDDLSKNHKRGRAMISMSKQRTVLVAVMTVPAALARTNGIRYELRPMSATSPYTVDGQVMSVDPGSDVTLELFISE